STPCPPAHTVGPAAASRRGPCSQRRQDHEKPRGVRDRGCLIESHPAVPRIRPRLVDRSDAASREDSRASAAFERNGVFPPLTMTGRGARRLAVGFDVYTATKSALTQP